MVVPDTPTVSRRSDTSALVEWSVPPNDGLVITLFRIQYRDVSSARDVSAHSSLLISLLRSFSTHVTRYASVYMYLYVGVTCLDSGADD